ncbi:ribosome-binding factor A [Luteococcus japonicus]|uniref:Ribosome-binding factor A n=2 Tax=Luteococcus japonicus TaxID=33984 RepID=A0A1R4J4X7_9ACTN|nr:MULTISPECIES: 30S ribosome-binding factor RbfA [Luteococcus]MDN5563810.1 30S ribosome-binding factor RbfA [Luteococcus sp.]ROR55748.1 ribosome-binding factor A [Luteococcus japonicus]SJN27059.1 Ribosome-binding factor A [Luteococcus japonicus LSP_Lj1]
MTNPRVAKLADQIKMITAEMLERRIKDPRLGFVTVTDVRLTGDSREATVFYTVFTEEEPGGTAAALESAKGLIRSTIGKKLGLRFAPSIAFIPDSTPEAAAAIEDLLARVQAGDAELAKQREGKTFAGDADPYKHDDEDSEED